MQTQTQIQTQIQKQIQIQIQNSMTAAWIGHDNVTCTRLLTAGFTKFKYVDTQYITNTSGMNVLFDKQSLTVVPGNVLIKR